VSRRFDPITRRDLIARGASFALAASLRPASAGGGTRSTGTGSGASAANRAQSLPPNTQELLRRTIPSSNESIPAIGLGTWQTFDVGTTDAERGPLRNVLHSFVQAGGKVIDSSPMYGRSESVVGDLLDELELRQHVFLATKVWTRGQHDGIAQMRTSLQRLRAQRIDLMQVHNLVDLDTHLRTLADWKHQGLVRYVGITHYTASAHADLVRAMQTHAIDFVQVNYSLSERAAQDRVLPAALEHGIAVLVNRPFAEGALFAHVQGREVPAWAAEFGIRSWAQLFLKWIVAHPAVTCAIPATADPRHLADNMGALVGPVPDSATRDRLARAFEG
jgi:diketogulonate reductase-like aldo/keto reductase